MVAWAWIDSVSFNKCQHDLALQPLCLARWGEGGAGSMLKCGRAVSFLVSQRIPTILYAGNGDCFQVTGLQGACECVCMPVSCLVTVCGRLFFFPPKGLNTPIFVEHPWNQSVFGVIIVNCLDYSINSSN